MHRRALLPRLPAGGAFLQLLGVAVPPDPVVELLAVGLLAPPQHRQRAPRLLHHVHDAVQQLGGVEVEKGVDTFNEQLNAFPLGYGGIKGKRGSGRANVIQNVSLKYTHELFWY